MKAIGISLLLVLFSGESIASEKAQHVQAAEAINSQSVSSFGLSFRALAYLFEISPGSFIPTFAVEESGAIQYIKELESKGYIEVKKVMGLPGGQLPDQPFITMRPTEKAENIKAAFREIQHRTEFK